MTTGPQDPAAAGRDRLRARHADCEQVIEALKDAFVQGRLTRDELDARVAQTLASRTYAELAALTADIPPAPAAAGPARPPAPARRWPLVRAAAGSGGCLVIAAAAFWGATILDPGPPAPSPDHYWAPLMLLIVLAAVLGASPSWGTGWSPPGSRDAPAGGCRPAGAGRPRPGRRTARRHRPWPGSPRSPPRPGPRRRAGSQVTAAPAAHSRPGGPGSPWRASGARRGMTPVRPAPGPVPAWLSRLGLTS